MTASVLITGALFRTPERRTSLGGKAFVRATIKVQSATDNGADFWNLLCFSETTNAELIELADGDRLSVVGTLKLELYPGRISRTVFVDRILPLRRKRKETSKTSASGTSKPPFDDEIGF